MKKLRSRRLLGWAPESGRASGSRPARPRFSPPVSFHPGGRLSSNVFFCALVLSLLGIVLGYSAGSHAYGPQYGLLELKTRLLHLGLALCVFYVVKDVRQATWRKASKPLYLGAAVALVLVLVPGLGLEAGGARRWLDLPFFDPQPAEFAKIAAVLLLSCAVSRSKPCARLPLRPLAAVGLLFVLVLVEPDFGTSVVLLAGVAGVLWASELRTRALVLSCLGSLVALAVVMVLEPYRRQRFLSFLDPWAVADGSGYQVVQSVTAIREGGLVGSGAGGAEHAPGVPEIDTDMIFALLGEELGLLGTGAVICAFFFLAFTGFKIALNASTMEARCRASGLTAMIFAQSVFNMGAVMSVFPLSGMTLPFLSGGGSSLLVCFAAVGMLHRIAKDGETARGAQPRGIRRKARTRKDGSEEDRDVLRPSPITG